MKKRAFLLLIGLCVCAIAVLGIRSYLSKSHEKSLANVKKNLKNIDSYKCVETIRIDYTMPEYDSQTRMKWEISTHTSSNPFKKTVLLEESRVYTDWMHDEESGFMLCYDDNYMYLFMYADMDSWAKIPLSDPAIYLQGINVDSSDPLDSLAIYLQHATHIDFHGVEPIDGRDCYRYNGTIEGESLSDMITQRDVLGGNIDSTSVPRLDMGDTQINLTFFVDCETDDPVRLTADFTQLTNQVLESKGETLRTDATEHVLAFSDVNTAGAVEFPFDADGAEEMSYTDYLDRRRAQFLPD